MKASKAPKKLYLNPDILPHSQSGKFLFINYSGTDESKCTIEYTRTDTLIEKACEWFKNNWREYVNTDKDGVVCFGHWEKDFKKYMEGE